MMRSPQKNFYLSVRDILTLIRQDDSSISRILDCPGGDGTITKALAKDYPDITFTCLDISQYEISKLQNVRLPNNLKASLGDLHKLTISNNEYDIWLIINSLFLLPNLDDVLKKLNKFKYVIVIIPNIKSHNFELFNSQHHGVNIHKLSLQDVIDHFQAANLTSIKVKSMGYRPRFKLNIFNKILKYFPLIDQYPILTNVCNYHLIYFKRN